MIPYEQLVSALTSWRQRKGLPTTSADLSGASVGDLGGYPGQASEASGRGARYDHGEQVEEMSEDAILADEVHELGDDHEVDASGVIGDGGAEFDAPESTAISGMPSVDAGSFADHGVLDDDVLPGEHTDGGRTNGGDGPGRRR